MKYSIRTKIIILIFVAIILLSFILSRISLYFTSEMTNEYAYENMSLICEKTAAEINAMFDPLENAVGYMNINALEEVSNPMNLMDEIYLGNYLDKLRSILWSTSSNVDGVVAAYLRVDPELCGPVAGIFLTRDTINSDMRDTEITDLSAYDKTDTEHVGWYYEPIEAQRPIWMEPYYNQNIGIYMISYVVPLIKNDSIFGVVGMDVNFDYITEQVKKIKIYDSGYAYITDSAGDVIYHPELKYGESIRPKNDWWSSKCELNNGMVLHVTAPEVEINGSSRALARNMLISVILIMILFIFTTILITNKMITPLRKLNKIALEISAGNYDVDFDFKRPNDEIGQLTTSFENTVATLKEYMSYINGLAYKDALTGVRNRTAYDLQIRMLEEALEKGEKMSIFIAVFDVNNLKKVNDNLGHEKGDVLIKEGCNTICQVFKRSAVFRIGGDEFVAIIRNVTEEEVERQFSIFEDAMKETWDNENIEYRVSVAHGYASYDPSIDKKQLDTVFKRADSRMYENKIAMKKLLK